MHRMLIPDGQKGPTKTITTQLSMSLNLDILHTKMVGLKHSKSLFKVHVLVNEPEHTSHLYSYMV